jgi:glycosyltransferase involved in cell wall biosynthesis
MRKLLQTNKIVFVANQFIGNNISTGGDVLFTEILKRTKINTIYVIAPLDIHPILSKINKNIILISNNFISSKKLNVDNFLSSFLVVINYFVSGFKTFLWLKKNSCPRTTIYLTGDFICNTIPILFLNKKLCYKILCNFFHINEKFYLRKTNPYWRSFFSRLLQKISIFIIRNKGDYVYLLNKIQKKNMIKMNFHKKKLIVSGAGINLENVNYRKKEKNLILFLGRVNYTKGIYDLLEVLKILKNSYKKNFFCNIVGSISNFDSIQVKRKIKYFNLSNNVKLMNYVTENEKKIILTKSSILAFPSREEGYGIVIHEALLYGLYIICYDLEILKHLFSKFKQVFFIKKFNILNYAKKLNNVLNYKFAKPNKYLMSKLQSWDQVYEIQRKYF